MAARSAFATLIASIIVLPAACVCNGTPSKPDATPPAASSSEEAETPPPAKDACGKSRDVCKQTVGSASRTYIMAKSTQAICGDAADAGVAVHPHASDTAKVEKFGQGECESELAECEKIRSTVVKDMADALDMMGKACGYSK
ncbi:MAG: hypothetical protein RDU25_02510 [Patescibacteria group bacterium]|nr:hypothetical protein [Patescibacteria group bacterium]